MLTDMDLSLSTSSCSPYKKSVTKRVILLQSPLLTNNSSGANLTNSSSSSNGKPDPNQFNSNSSLEEGSKMMSSEFSNTSSSYNYYSTPLRMKSQSLSYQVNPFSPDGMHSVSNRNSDLTLQVHNDDTISNIQTLRKMSENPIERDSAFSQLNELEELEKLELELQREF